MGVNRRLERQGLGGEILVLVGYVLRYVWGAAKGTDGVRARTGLCRAHG